MTYEEIKNQIRDLGFSDDAEMEDFDSVVPNAVNMAIEEINQFAGGVIGTYDLSIYPEDKLIFLDMLNIDENYISLTDEVPIMIKDDGINGAMEYLRKQGYDSAYINNYMYDSEYKLSEDGKALAKEHESDKFEKFNNFETRNGQQLLCLKVSEVTGRLRIYYKKLHTKFTTSSSNERIELPNRVMVLVPLLSAYYLWLEDDETKAIYYYNRYETLLQQVLKNDSSNKPKIRILEGGI